MGFWYCGCCSSFSVWVNICVGSVMYGFLILVCVLVYTVFGIVCTVLFLLFHLCIFILICSVCTSVRTTIQTDRTIPNNKPDIVIRDYEK
jgi:hypothetical protein